jgi:hypothetical protein
MQDACYPVTTYHSTGCFGISGTHSDDQIDRLASWWWSWTRVKPIHLGIWRMFPFPWQGSAFSESPPERRSAVLYCTRSKNAYIQLLVGSAGTTIHWYVHTKCVLQACFWQTGPKSIFLPRTSQLPSIGLNLMRSYDTGHVPAVSIPAVSKACQHDGRFCHGSKATDTAWSVSVRANVTGQLLHS